MRRLLSIAFLLYTTLTFAQKQAEPAIEARPAGSGFQFVNKETGQPVNNQVWDETDPFVNGFSRVFLNNRFSFVSGNGKLISPVIFEDARNFAGKLAAVKKDGKWGFINESGKIIFGFTYDIVFDFEASISVAFENKTWKLINNKGKQIMALDISVCFGFKNGKAKIIKDGKEGILNTDGEIIFTNTQSSNKKPVLYHPNSTSTTADCPDNIDFEYGDFTNWQCYTGRVDSVGNTNVITVNPSPPTVNRHEIITRAATSALDPFGLFPTNPPDGSNYAVKLGNTNVGAEAERITYTIHVPLNDSNFSIKYDYAVVLQDPGHTIWTQPRFNAKLLDSATNTYIDCASFEYISTSGLPGFEVSPVNSTVIFKPWSSVFFSLRGYGGQTLYLEFTTADCVRRAHWGYAYVDVESTCGQAIDMQYDCTYPNITTLTGPPGFQFYNWWDQTFSTIVDTGQQVTLNPGPVVNTVMWLEMIPFNNFGCTDTLQVVITGNLDAQFDVSDTTVPCAPHTFTFYNRNLPSTSTLWDFGDGTTGTGDTVTHTYLIPGTYIVNLDVTVPSGCNGSVQHTVTILNSTGSFVFTSVSPCNNQQVRFDATVFNVDSLFWDFGDGTFLRTKLLRVFHTYTSPGIFIVRLNGQSIGGCQIMTPVSDTIRVEMLDPGFSNTELKTCGSTTLNFTDTSYSFFGISAYAWNFGDGNTGTGSTVSHSYTSTGTYNIQLIITGVNGCTDTLIKPVYVKINEIPLAAITGVTQQCTLVPVTFQSTVQSADPIISTDWTASNGDSGTGNSFSVTFAQPGPYTIQFITTTIFGCTDTAFHQILINPTPDVALPPDQTLCNGFTTNQVIFSGTVNGTNYSWTNSNTNTGLAASGNGNIAAFIAVNTSNTPITSRITVRPTTATCNGATKTFNLVVNPTPPVAAGNDQNVCLGNSIQLAASGAALYNWSPPNDLSCVGCSNPVATPTDSMRYIVRGESIYGCIAFDTVLLNVSKPFRMLISPNDTLCIGESTNLQANGAYRYLWSPPQGLSRTDIADPKATPNTTTLYRVVGYDEHNCFTDTNFVKIWVGPIPTVNIGPDLTLSTGSVVTLNPVTQNGPIIDWAWSPSAGLSCADCPSPVLTVRDNIYYQLTVTNDFGCKATDLISISSFCKSAQVFIPNAFTPDGDGLNDILMVRGVGIFVKSFRIFNRWGELVFEKTNFNPNDPKFGWDGKVRGVPATPDVFVYTADVICDNDVIYTYKGNTTLLK